MVFVFYTICLIVMMMVRPALSWKLLPGKGKMAIYSAMYFLPALIVIHAVCAGLICNYLIFFNFHHDRSYYDNGGTKKFDPFLFKKNLS